MQPESHAETWLENKKGTTAALVQKESHQRSYKGQYQPISLVVDFSFEVCLASS